MVFQQLFGGKTAAEVDAEKAPEEHEKALTAEIEAASKGTIDELRARVAEYQAEAGRVQDGLLIARAREEVNADTHRPERPGLQQRSRDLRVITGAIENQLRRLRGERGEKLALDWNKSAQTRHLVDAYLTQRAEQLATVAALVTSFETEARAGATVTKMIPLPVKDCAELRAFEAHVDSLRRWGFKPDVATWPDAVRARVEA